MIHFHGISIELFLNSAGSRGVFPFLQEHLKVLFISNFRLEAPYEPPIALLYRIR